jgi:hypothetical protein
VVDSLSIYVSVLFRFPRNRTTSTAVALQEPLDVLDERLTIAQGAIVQRLHNRSRSSEEERRRGLDVVPPGNGSIADDLARQYRILSSRPPLIEVETWSALSNTFSEARRHIKGFLLVVEDVNKRPQPILLACRQGGKLLMRCYTRKILASRKDLVCLCR